MSCRFCSCEHIATLTTRLLKTEGSEHLQVSTGHIQHKHRHEAQRHEGQQQKPSESFRSFETNPQQQSERLGLVGRKHQTVASSAFRCQVGHSPAEHKSRRRHGHHGGEHSHTSCDWRGPGAHGEAERFPAAPPTPHAGANSRPHTPGSGCEISGVRGIAMGGFSPPGTHQKRHKDWSQRWRALGQEHLQREKVTIKEPVRTAATGLSKPQSGAKGFPHRLPFFTGNKTKTIPLGIHFKGPDPLQDVAEMEKAEHKAKSRSLESSPEKGDSGARPKVDPGSAGTASHHWLRKQKSIGAHMSRTNSMELQTTSKHNKVKFPDIKKSASWAHFVEASQVEAPQLEMEVPEQYVCDMSALFLGQKFASGNHSRLYQGVYNDQDVAVKLLRLDSCGDAAVTARIERQFMQEVHCLSQLHHPNIVRFVAASWKRPVCCLIMEYVPGGSLRAFLHTYESGSMPRKMVLSMALDVAYGMEYLHSQGVVHRDLKSENLVLTEDLHIKLTDFGVGCLETECDKRSADTGTYRWMAPEMISHKHYSKKVDVYSFGIVLWELVTGLLPFKNMTPVQVAYAVVNKNLRPSIPEDCPSTLRYLMEDCWLANPERRPNFYQIVQILEDLDKSWTEEPYHQQYARSILFG